jgi:hypothetical protein
VMFTVRVIPVYRPVPSDTITGAVPESTAEQVFRLLTVGSALFIFALSAVAASADVEKSCL